ncbi:MAG TPA: hypothetical protein VLG13_03120 [Patescibacteria group bacterium]|nr:hypothetical protein [Patescibacteria group bacterium]
MPQGNERLHGGGAPVTAEKPSHPDMQSPDEIEAKKRYQLDRFQEVASHSEQARMRSETGDITNMSDEEFGQLCRMLVQLGVASAALLRSGVTKTVSPFSLEEETYISDRIGNYSLVVSRYPAEPIPSIPPAFSESYGRDEHLDQILGGLAEAPGEDMAGNSHMGQAGSWQGKTLPQIMAERSVRAEAGAKAPQDVII